ncbi:PIR protein [Plasmodium vivax]|uniref:VIR protein n=1 Tax=Plasmodium vivax TaxID=5855 RepID=A0A564ZPR0_PLAVI|nr:PIR protein [Plasmodium vivax]
MSEYKDIYTADHFLDGNEEVTKNNLIRLYYGYFNDACTSRSIAYSYCKSLDNYKSVAPRIWELYKKFERNLLLIYDKSKKFDNEWEMNEEKLCFYLKYWTYDQLISKKVTNTEYANFLDLWDMRKKQICPTCKCEFKVRNLYNLIQLKKAYDYYLFLDAYNKTAKINDQISDKNYCKYIEDSKVVYSSFEYKCERDRTEYCKEFKENKLPRIDEEDYDSISCQSDLRHEPISERGSRTDDDAVPRAQARTVDGLTGPEAPRDNIVLPPSRENEDTSEKSHPGYALPPEMKDHIGAHDLPNTFPGAREHLFNPDSGSNSVENGNPMRTIASASLVGIPSIVFLLYKFTPFRALVDPHIRKTKKMLMNPVNDNNEFQSHDYNFNETNMDFNRYNIAYESR